MFNSDAKRRGIDLLPSEEDVPILVNTKQKWPHSFEQQPEFLKWILC